MGTALLAFTTQDYDTTFRGQVTVPLMKDVKRQSPTAICELSPGIVNRHVIVNRTVPPFDNANLRRALALAAELETVEAWPQRAKSRRSSWAWLWRIDTCG